MAENEDSFAMNTSLRRRRLIASHWRLTLPHLFTGLALLAAGPGRAQNSVKNPDFEQPLGPDNWTFEYAAVHGPGNQPTNCGPYDFWIADRSTAAHKLINAPWSGMWDGEDGTKTNYWCKFGGHIAPNHTGRMHGYFKQVVKHLDPGASYTISAWMAFFSNNDGYLAKCNIYLEALGGQGSQTTPYPAGNVQNVRGNIPGWQRYAVTNTATAAGEIEVRLHFNKYLDCDTWEFKNFNAYYDHVAVTPTGRATYQPPYTITSFTRANQTISLTWQSVMNNAYRIQVSSDLENPNSWSWLPWSPKVDTNLYAPGETFTFQTNLTSLFSQHPGYNPDAPLFFRIYAKSFEP